MGLSFFELLLILLVVLLVFGGRRIPELARALGRALAEFRKAQKDFEKEIDDPDERK